MDSPSPPASPAQSTSSVVSRPPTVAAKPTTFAGVAASRAPPNVAGPSRQAAPAASGRSPTNRVGSAAPSRSVLETVDAMRDRISMSMFTGATVSESRNTVTFKLSRSSILVSPATLGFPIDATATVGETLVAVMRAMYANGVFMPVPQSLVGFDKTKTIKGWADTPMSFPRQPVRGSPIPQIIDATLAGLDFLAKSRITMQHVFRAIHTGLTVSKPYVGNGGWAALNVMMIRLRTSYGHGNENLYYANISDLFPISFAVLVDAESIEDRIKNSSAWESLRVSGTALPVADVGTPEWVNAMVEKVKSLNTVKGWNNMEGFVYGCYRHYLKTHTSFESKDFLSALADLVKEEVARLELVDITLSVGRECSVNACSAAKALETFKLELEGHKSDMNTQIQIIQKQARDVKDESALTISSLTQELKATKESLEAAQRVIAHNEEELKRVKKTYEDIIKDLRSNLKMKSDHYEQTVSRYDELETQHSALKDHAAFIEKERDKAIESNNAFLASANDSGETSELALKEVVSLRERLEESEGKRASLELELTRVRKGIKPLAQGASPRDPSFYEALVIVTSTPFKLIWKGLRYLGGLFRSSS